MWIFEDEIVGTIDTFHFLNHRVGSEGIEGFSFGDTDIYEIFFKSEIFSSDFEVTDIVSFCSIDIENPYIIDSKNSDHKECENICLGKTESVILPRSFSLGEKEEWIAFHDQYVCIHRLQRWELWKNSFFEIKSPIHSPYHSYGSLRFLICTQITSFLHSFK